MKENNIELSQDTKDIANDETSNTPYDDAHKTLAHDCRSLLIPMIRTTREMKKSYFYTTTISST